MRRAAASLLAIGASAVLVKGGHLEEGSEAADLFADASGEEWLAAPRIETRHTHGTGCTLSAAIAAHLAGGADLRDAVLAGKSFVTEAIRHALALGRGIGPVDQLWSVAAPQEPPTHDPLTGLANRGLFDELLARALFRGERSGSPVAVLSVGLDGSGNVNDAFGHPGGDGVLMEVGRRLEWAVRPGDLVARLGADGFAVLCENLGSTSDAERIAERVVESVSKGVPVASGVASITVSVGIAVASPGEDARSLFDRAERAMHEVKREGRTGYRLAGLSGD
jgi:diguanylate cyclase (GGDEF)-like protein